MSALSSVTGETFEEQVKNSPVPVIVDFGASWCSPCRQSKPIFEALHQESNGKFKVVTVDIDECEGLASDHSVSAIPTVLIFKNGVETARFVGVLPKQKYLEAVS